MVLGSCSGGRLGQSLSCSFSKLLAAPHERAQREAAKWLRFRRRGWPGMGAWRGQAVRSGWAGQHYNVYFTPKPIFLPLHCAEQKQRGRSSFGLLTEAAALAQVSFLFPASGAARATRALAESPDVPLCLAGAPVHDPQSCGFCCFNCSKPRKLVSCPTSLLSL